MSRALAWMVHAITASGAVMSLLAIAAAADGRWRVALTWMIAAMAVDAVDGTLARLLRVRDHTPELDGTLLDNIVDYLGYAVVPAWILMRAGLVPAGAEFLAAAAVLMSSAYQFSQVEAKTSDHFFKGFPSYWNIAVFYMFFVPAPPEANLLAVMALAMAVFVPLKWAYPSRMRRLRRLTVALTAAWGLTLLLMLRSYPATPLWLTSASLAYVLYYAGVSLWLSRHPAAAAADSAGR